MMTRRLAGVSIAAIAAFVVGAGPAAQVSLPGFPPIPGQTPARDATRNPVGTATVSGVVLTGDAPGRPLRRVRVTLQSADVRAPLSAVTGDDGRFQVTGVVAGHYILSASRLGYVDTVYGAEPGGMMGVPVAVADGEEVSGITIHVPRGGVITGVVRSPNGRPVRGAQVMVSAVRTVDGRRRTRFNAAMLATAGMSGTDDRGIYRRYGLPPGEYVVQVIGDQPFGRGNAVRQTSAGEIAWAERLASAPGAGSAGAAAAGPAAGPMVARVPIYFPGATSLDAAQVITIGPGEERGGVDVVLQDVPTARVSGVVLDADGRPRSGVTVRLNPKGAGASIVDMLNSVVGQATVTDDTGAFAIDPVVPGDYVASAQASKPGDTPEVETPDDKMNLMTLMSTMFGRGGGAGALHAAAPVAVTGQDVGGVTLRLGEGATISGTLAFDGAAAPPAANMMQVMLAPATQSSSPIELGLAMTQSVMGAVAQDLTFAVKGVPPGRYRAIVNLPGSFMGQALPTATWTLKSIAGPGGVDLADTPFEVEPGRSLEGVVVSLTDRPTVISGRVVDGEGRPSSAFPIVVFSTNPAHWMPGSRRVQQVRPASDGRYRIAGLPGGEYYVGAVTTIELDDLYDASFLQQIVPIAFKVTIADGETREQDLRIGR
jgi:hypothetical protein